MGMVFDQQSCTVCGECLHQCPVMKLPLEVARDEMKKLLAGQETRYVLQRCESCFACNSICPEGLNPTGLILERWHEKYEQDGLPQRARYFMPHSRVNFRTTVINQLPDDEKALLRAWDDASPCEEIFYPGCNWLTVPYLSRTRLMDGMNIRGCIDLCCGEMYYRMGHFDELEQVAKKLSNHFQKMGIRKMIIPCTAGFNMFNNVLPEYGAKFDFEVLHFLPIILDKILSGEIVVKNRLDMRVTIQESCHAKCVGEEFLDIPRKILNLIGCNVIEQDPCRDKALCCGIGGGFSHFSAYDPIHMMRSTITTLRNARKTRAQAMATYCAGCMQMLAVGQIYYPLGWMPVYHILELVQLAIGEKPQRLYRKRAWQMLAGTLRNQLPDMASRKRFHIKDIA